MSNRFALFLLFFLTTGCLGLEATSEDGLQNIGNDTAISEITLSKPDLCGNGVCDPQENCSNCAQDCNDSTGGTCPRIGMVFYGRHQPGVAAKAASDAVGHPWITVEDYLRQRSEPPSSSQSFSQLVGTPQLASPAYNFYYQYTPAIGFTCFYHPRSSSNLHFDIATLDSADPFSCPNYAGVLRDHATKLVKLGVDFVVFDARFMSDLSQTADLLQLRPFEILVEEWAALRAEGIQTPDIAVWQVIPAQVNDPNSLYPLFLDIYNEKAYDRMFLRDRESGKKVFFWLGAQLTDPSASPNVITSIETNGGRHDVVAIPLFVNLEGIQGWNFMANCRGGTFLSDSACDQNYTVASRLGSQIAVSSSYQDPESLASHPFGAVGVYHGQTLKQQFHTALAVQPNYILTSQWNDEFDYLSENSQDDGYNMGMETESALVNKFFIENYGVEFSRDVAPSREYGSLVYDTYASCVRVFRTGQITCSDMNEICCQNPNFSSDYAYFSGDQGIFGVSAVNPNNDRRLLLQCQVSSTDSLLSINPNCEGRSTIKVVGYISTAREGENLRALYRCLDTRNGLSHSYSLTGGCPASQGNVEGMLGFVR